MTPTADNQVEGNASVFTTDGSVSILDQVIDRGKLARDESQRSYARDIIGEFASQILDEGMTTSKDTVAMIKRRIAEIDEMMSNQLNLIMHHEDFQKLEGAWRGLHHIVQNSETGTGMKLRVLPVSKKELLDDLERAPEFDQSTLFKKLYEEEYGMFGGNPYGLLIGDYEFGRHPQDVELARQISQVAAAAHAPFIAAAAPALFALDSYEGLNAPRDLAKIFETAEMTKWRSFRKTEDSRYFVLTLPRVLMRLPYGPDTKPVEEFGFVEDVTGKDHSKYCWGNSAYALGVRINDAFSKYGWCSAIRGVEGGGLVENLPLHTFSSDDGEIVAKIPTEVPIPDRRDKELSDLGFIALCNQKGTDVAAFFGGQTVNQPIEYQSADATANARISAQLPYMLAVSRFAHYLKVIMRDKLGSFQSKSSIENFLNNWISNYVLLSDDAGQELKARYPLREARVEVTEIAGKPGAYNAVVFLRPHFQLEELRTSLRLVAQLPQSAR